MIIKVYPLIVESVYKVRLSVSYKGETFKKTYSLIDFNVTKQRMISDIQLFKCECKKNKLNQIARDIERELIKYYSSNQME